MLIEMRRRRRSGDVVQRRCGILADDPVRTLGLRGLGVGHLLQGVLAPAICRALSHQESYG
jgi:hypothetical protein